MSGALQHNLPQSNDAKTAQEACAAFEEAGWDCVAEGDWSWVFAAPDRNVVARITPWDPAYLLYAGICLRYPDNPYLPRIEKVSHLASGSYVIVMERLQPADPEQAAALCYAIGLGNDTGGTPDWTDVAMDTSILEEDEDLAQLRQILKDALDFGHVHLPFWGGSDIGTGDVMVDPSGQLKLLDPFFIKGAAIIEAILNRRGDLLSRIPREEIKAFLNIPRLEARYASDPDIDEVRRIAHDLTAEPRNPFTIEACGQNRA
jgi:hypothetical protein